MADQVRQQPRHAGQVEEVGSLERPEQPFVAVAKADQVLSNGGRREQLHDQHRDLLVRIRAVQRRGLADQLLVERDHRRRAGVACVMACRQSNAMARRRLSASDRRRDTG